ncbi:hypothetical protein [Leptospira licerasiae]|uniref:hypothetical protein n=1 Tax=Leptospira licerasiae TaxID=447106 RepID=UPI001FEDDAF2|nr:hypothetical protein [Leptospira licerasiae]
MESLVPHSLSNTVLIGKKSGNLAHSFMAQLASAGERVHIFDCAIRFNLFSITKFLNDRPLVALHNIEIQRAFTPYQLLDSLSDLIAEDKDPGIFPLIVFLSPAKQFFDKDVKQKEREHLLSDLIFKLEQIRAKGFRFLIVESSRKDNPLYNSYIERLYKRFGAIEKEKQRTELVNGQDNLTLFSAD